MVSPTPAVRALFDAIYAVDVEEVRRLLNSGVDANSVLDGTALEYAACRESVPLVALLLERGARVPPFPLYDAVLTDDTQVLEYFVSLGADVNATDEHGSTALDMAVSEGNVTVVRWLLDRGAMAAHPVNIARIKPLLSGAVSGPA